MTTHTSRELRALLDAAVDGIIVIEGTPAESRAHHRGTSSAIRDPVVDEKIRVASKPIEADELLAMMRELIALTN